VEVVSNHMMEMQIQISKSNNCIVRRQMYITNRCTAYCPRHLKYYYLIEKRITQRFHHYKVNNKETKVLGKAG